MGKTGEEKKVALGISNQQRLFIDSEYEVRGTYQLLQFSLKQVNDPGQETMSPLVSIPWLAFGSRKGSLSKTHTELLVAVWLKPQDFCVYPL